MWVSAGHIPILFLRGLPVLPKLGNGEPHFLVPPVVQVWDVIGQNQIQLLGIWPMGWDIEHSRGHVWLSVVASAEGPGSSFLGARGARDICLLWMACVVRAGDGSIADLQMTCSGCLGPGYGLGRVFLAYPLGPVCVTLSFPRWG